MGHLSKDTEKRLRRDLTSLTSDYAEWLGEQLYLCQFCFKRAKTRDEEIKHDEGCLGVQLIKELDAE